MAWTEVCKMDFAKQIEHKKSQGISVRQALKMLSEESGIPIGTLTNWLYPDSRQKAIDKYQESVCKTTNTTIAPDDYPLKEALTDLTEDEKTQIFKDAEQQIIKAGREIKNTRTAEKRQKNLEIAEKKAKKYIPDDSIQIVHADFYEYCKDIEDNSIDLILTDPPYPAEFLHVWGQLGEIAARVLKPSAFLITYSGQLYLDRVMKDLGQHLIYYWMSSLQHTQRGVVQGRNMMCGWKPILLYQKEPFSKIEYLIKDFMDMDTMDKDLHEWQQGLATFEFFIQHFTKPNDLILEPFMGSGTTLAAAKKLQRRCIGIDIDEKCLTLTKGRLINEV